MRESIEGRRRRLDPDPPSFAPAFTDERSPRFAAILSALLPGLGQCYAGRWRRGFLCLAIPFGLIAVIALATMFIDPFLGILVRRAEIVVTIGLGGAFLYHLAVAGEAFTVGHGIRGILHRRGRDYLALGVVALVLVVLYGGVYRQSAAWAGLATRLFAPEQRAGVPGAAPAPTWSGTDRLNVLVLGIDTRGPNDTDRNTDTMIVMTLDPLNKTAGMLSIPRDVYIDRPGLFQEKVNAAYAVGGPDLSRKVVEDLLGIRINAYGLLDFEAFTKIVDSAGGVFLDVRKPLRDEAYPTAAFGIQRLNILAGPQLMHGAVALRYARTRHGSNDYDRAARQQDVVSALRTRLSAGDVLARLPVIMDQVGPAVRTNFDPSDILPAARLGAGIDRSSIQSEVLYPCAGDFTHCELREQNTPGGFYLFPDRPKIADLVAHVFYDPRVKQEAARIELRGTGARKDIVTALGPRLEARAYTVQATVDAPAARTTVYVRNEAKRYTADALAVQLGLRAAVLVPSGDPSTADVIATIGSDYRGLAGDAGR